MISMVLYAGTFMECRRGCGFIGKHPSINRHELNCLTPRTLARLYEIGNVVIVGDCHEFRKRISTHGYGRLADGRKAHRVAWEIANDRPVPTGLNILHSCDNPPCVNPAHLRPGTQKDNIDDMTARGRARGRFETIDNETRTCPICGHTHERKPSSKTVTCSLSCAARLSWLTKPDRQMGRKTATGKL